MVVVKVVDVVRVKVVEVVEVMMVVEVALRPRPTWWLLSVNISCTLLRSSLARRSSPSLSSTCSFNLARGQPCTTSTSTSSITTTTTTSTVTWKSPPP